jgi:hypothetical protein
MTVLTFILSFSFAFAQSIAKSVSRCTAARKTFSAGSWPAIEAAGKKTRGGRTLCGTCKTPTDNTAKNA